MKTDDYLTQIKLLPLKLADAQVMAGDLMGKAIKDPHVLPDQYAILCKEAIKLGFKFANIQFQ
jgi:hypothetical protein